MGRKLLFVASTGAHICQFHLPYLQQLRQEGWTVHVACSDPAGGIPHADRVLELPFQKRMLSFANLRAAGLLARHIRKEGYRGILVHTSLAAFFTRLALLGRKARPRVINMVHGYLFDDRTPFLKRTVLLAAEKLTAPVTDLVITMNRCDADIARKHRLCKNVATVPGVGVDFARLEAPGPGSPTELRRSLGIREEDYVLIYPAEFSRRKRQSVLLHAMTRLKEDTVLVLPGEGRELARCQKLARRLGISHRVCFPGHVQDMAPWYAMANAAVSVSRSEGLPFNIMEAMYFGLPVVASDVKGHTDLIRHRETGLLFPPDDPAACAGEIRCLREDPWFAEKMAQAARQDAMQYGLPAVQPRVMELYRQSLNGR